MLQTSKLTTKYQATVPTSVRKVLQLKAGDMLGFEISGDEVKLIRILGSNRTGTNQPR